MRTNDQFCDKATERMIRRVRLGYWTALLVIALMAMGTFLLVDSAISTQRSVNKLVHIAGEQQMLSQRIVLLTNTATVERGRFRRASSLSHLRDAVNDFERNFRTLEIKLDRDKASDAVRAIMTEAPHDVNFFSRDLLVKARAFLAEAGANPQSDVRPLPQLSATAVLAGYAMLSDHVAMEAQRGIDRTSSLHRMVFMMMMLVLALEALLIFRPLVGDIVLKTGDLIRTRNDMAFMAQHDQLTGLLNRKSIEDHVHRMTSEGAAERPFALMHVDMDDFKSINDTYGHAVGDAFLIEIAKRISKGLREKDAVARFGGDEFVVVLDGVRTHQNARAVAEHVATLIGKPVHFGDITIDPKASIGTALCPEDADGFDELMFAADLAMYHAKSGGRGRFSAFDPQMRADYESRLKAGSAPVGDVPLKRTA
ncbi:MAG: diguanylate cyclase [Roseitalea sp.]|uniref:Diguanylate cyclase n=1 Tax=Oceaniradius stylonematis TaxID=2184161 RepID=A0A3A8AK21_9HYPH|nr:diguanylate cyclase [Oceaniradius stylonematis]MBO6553590.1 diguanylate cyclase [Roseitalea sp.]MBO6952633.1 diguanylate cyclase [Rhizobiaceae bacterium]RNC96349.1 MAG: diguanylate cyclase [Oricola sp.]MBO6592880.1 diguanylate cyclase [Roseitalea sp.]MBO6600377.1 diguanylate cyclase [Roseitalea sp.]